MLESEADFADIRSIIQEHAKLIAFARAVRRKD